MGWWGYVLLCGGAGLKVSVHMRRYLPPSTRRQTALLMDQPSIRRSPPYYGFQPCQAISAALCRDTALLRPPYCGTTTVMAILYRTPSSGAVEYARHTAGISHSLVRWITYMVESLFIPGYLGAELSRRHDDRHPRWSRVHSSHFSSCDLIQLSLIHI